MRLSTLFSLSLLPLAVLIGCLLALDHAPHAFDPAVLSSIASRVHAHRTPPSSPSSPPPTLHSSLTLLQRELLAAYPHLIHPHDEWLFSLAGGFKCGLLLLHASLTEYVAVWGSAVDTVGHSGRNWAEFHDWLITGNGTWWEEGGLQVTQHTPPAYLRTERWAGRVVQLQGGTWMLELCQGVIPALLPFGLGDGLLSSLDPLLVWKSLRLYAWMTAHSLLQGKI